MPTCDANFAHVKAQVAPHPSKKPSNQRTLEGRLEGLLLELGLHEGFTVVPFFLS